ncbi:glycoside hydrolase family 31 protein [Acidipila rosea]|uniref:Alpha-glucosidase n=1 Tax=Acidipila rosea TaxID=768535 RepID=A0A4R1L7T5_9BACT|nr:TIM-barrel domain-containing protein [Acidipila rosea]TCK74295.1 alpha-glucosidase [Acidipila rosea]
MFKFCLRSGALLSLLGCVPFAVFAQATASFHATALPNGVEVQRDGTTMRVVALRDDVLRITAGHDGRMPEDASWAVLPQAMKAAVKVVQDSGTAGASFHTEALRVSISPDLSLTVKDAAGNVVQQDAAPLAWRKKGFELAKVKRDDDHFFGLGDKTGPLDHAGSSYTLWNTDTGFQESTDPIYKSIPFFMEFHGGNAMGVLLDSTWRTYFDFGKEDPAQYTFSSAGGLVSYYLMYGPTPKKVIEDYAWLTGPTPLPALWTLGFQQSRYSYETENRLMTVAHRLRADKIPADALYLDIDYQVKNRPFTINTEAFPDFRKMVGTLKQDHFHLVVITDLHIANLPNQGYAPYDSGVAGNHFVKNPDGTNYVGPVWPGPAVFPDFTRSVTRDWWGSLYKNFVADGVAGFWNDMNEPAIFRYPSKTMPDDVQHRIEEPGFKTRTTSHLEIHNVFGMENSRATYDGVLKLNPDARPFVLTRATYAGGQRYAATWTGDNDATWNHLRMTIPMLENLGLSGFGMAGADVGGFSGSPSVELLTRWIEIGAFQPIDRDHSAKNTRDHEPWVDGPAQEDIRRKFIDERYRLMPYFYTVAEEMSRTGLPIMRPLFVEFPHATSDGHPLDLDAGGHFMVGSQLLVAASPSPDQIRPYEVHLPPGTWYDYWSGERYTRQNPASPNDTERHDLVQLDKPIMVLPKLDELPVYVRGGTVLPMAPLVQSTDETPNGPLTLRVYPGDNCHGALYEDAGDGFAYRSGKYLRLRFTCETQPDGALTVRMEPQQAGFKPWWKQVRIEAYGWTPKAKQLTAGTQKVSLTKEHGAWSGTFSADPEASLKVVLR